MKTLKTALGLILALTMALSLMACGGDAPADDASSDADTSGAADTTDDAAADGEIDYASLKVGVVMKSFDEFQQAVMDGAKDAAMEAGILEENITMVAPTSESEIMSQVTMIEDLIAGGVNILVISANQADTIMNVLEQAHEKGVKIVFADTDAPDFEDKVSYIGTDNYDAAYQGALLFAETLEDSSNVVILRGKLGDPNHEARTLGLTTALEEKGHTVLETQDANVEADKAASAMEAFMTKYPGDIDAVMVTSDSMAVGAAQAAKGAGVIDDISICGFDGFQSAISLIPEGDIDMIIAQKPYFMGSESVKMALGSMQGETYDAYINPGIDMIDGNNYEDYLK